MSARRATFLDANAGVPLPHTVAEALRAYLDRPSELLTNPSSIHLAGRAARREVERSRSAVASSIGVDPHDPRSSALVFTSSGTSANALVVASVLGLSPMRPLRPAPARPRRWLVSSVEHASVSDWIPIARAAGVEVEILPVDSEGLLSLPALEAACSRGADLCTILWAHNETGVLQPIEALASLTRAAGVPLHLDAAQAWGKIPIDVTRLGADWLTLSGHKIGALPGVGVVYARERSKLAAFVPGTQEGSVFGGTENMLGIVSLGVAARELPGRLAAQQGLSAFRDQFESRLQSRIPGTRVHASGAPRVSGTSFLSFAGVTRPGLVAALDLEGFQVSAGAACSSGAEQPSQTLLAMGRPESEARASVRISFVEPLEPEEQEALIGALDRCVARLRESEARLRAR